jgi:hypothetical protein
MRNIILKYGLISGGLLSLMMASTVPFIDKIGFDNGAILGYTTMVLAFLLVYFGVRAYRDANGGEITFGRAFRVGITITAIASACYVATWQVVYYKFMPDFADKYAAHAIDKARADGDSDEEIARITVEMVKFNEMYKNPLVNIAFTFLEPLPVGLIMTLVAAGLLRRRPSAAMSLPA